MRVPAPTRSSSNATNTADKRFASVPATDVSSWHLQFDGFLMTPSEPQPTIPQASQAHGSSPSDLLLQGLPRQGKSKDDRADLMLAALHRDAAVVTLLTTAKAAKPVPRGTKPKTRPATRRTRRAAHHHGRSIPRHRRLGPRSTSFPGPNLPLVGRNGTAAN